MKSQGLNELASDCFVEISSEDADSYQIKDGDNIKVASRRGEIEARAEISEKAVEGTIFIPFHYASAAANMLTNMALDPTAKSPGPTAPS